MPLGPIFIGYDGRTLPMRSHVRLPLKQSHLADFMFIGLRFVLRGKSSGGVNERRMRIDEERETMRRAER
jgi:hypothetical protein